MKMAPPSSIFLPSFRNPVIIRNVIRAHPFRAKVEMFSRYHALHTPLLYLGNKRPPGNTHERVFFKQNALNCPNVFRPADRAGKTGARRFLPTKTEFPFFCLWRSPDLVMVGVVVVVVVTPGQVFQYFYFYLND